MMKQTGGHWDSGCSLEGAEPVKITVSLAVLHDIYTTLIECGEDIIANAEAEYPQAQRDQYPTYRRRYENTIQSGKDALALAKLMSTWPGFPPTPEDH